MYCINCGNKLDENADVCVKCGKFVNSRSIRNERRDCTEKNGRGIASMILSILAVLFTLILFASDYSEVSIYSDISSVIGYAIGCLLIPIVLAITALALSLVERRVSHNSFNMTGLILSMISFCGMGITFLLIVGSY